MKYILLSLTVLTFTGVFSQSQKSEVRLDTLKMNPIADGALDTTKWRWLKDSLKINIVPNPMPGKFTIQTESIHPVVSATKELVLEIYSGNGKFLSSEGITANGIYEFPIPQNNIENRIVYKLIWGNVYRTGMLEIIMN